MVAGAGAGRACAAVTVTGNDVLFEIDFGPAAFTIAAVAGVEIVTYSGGKR
jgi:hypothetical protein